MDGSAFSSAAARHAIHLAKACNAELTAFYAIHTNRAKPLSAESIEKEKARQAKLCFDEARLLAEKAGIKMESRVSASRSVVDAIIEEIESGDYDLVVVGSHGLSGFKKLLLGSVTEAILKHKPCPVLVV